MKKIYKQLLGAAAGIILSLNASAQTVLFNEDWSSSTFTANGWTFPNAQGNWTVGSSYTPSGGTSPNAYFNWSPAILNYTCSLLSNTINATSYTNGPIMLSYALKLDNFSTSTVEQFIVEYKTVGSSTWNTVATYSSATTGVFNWAVNNFTLTGMQGQNFQLRFTAFGPNSNNLNGWGVDNIVVSVPCIPGLNVSATPQCSAGSHTLTASGAANYTWSPGGSNASSIVVNPTVTTVYTVAATSTVGGCIDTRTVVINPNPGPTVNISGTPTVCANSSINLSASGANTYTWSTGSTGSSAPVTPTSTTVYSVTGADASGCTSTASFTVSVYNNLVANNAYVCATSGSANLSVNAVPGSTVNWYASPTSTSSIATGTTFATPVVSTNTTYYAQASSGSAALNSIFTTTAGGNSSPGNMFDVVVNNNIALTSVDMSIITAGTQSVEIWYRTGSFVGFESSSTGWNPVYSTTVNSMGTGTLTSVSGFTLPLSAGQTYGLYITVTSPGINVNYTNGTSLGATYVSNSDLIVKEGKGGGYFSVINSPRVFNGRLYYSGSSCSSAMTPVTLFLNSCAGVTSHTKNNMSLNLYPNPNNGRFTVELLNGSRKIIQVIDFSGRVVKTLVTDKDSEEIDMENFAAGLYYVKVESNGGSDVIKIVKQ